MSQAPTVQQCIERDAITHTQQAIEERAKKILMEMDQQIDETALRLDKMKASREAAKLSYTKLFAVPVNLPEPAIARVPQPGDSDEPETPSACQVVEHYFWAHKDKPHDLPSIRQGVVHLGATISDPYLYDLLARLIKERKIKRIERGIYAHTAFKVAK